MSLPSLWKRTVWSALLAVFLIFDFAVLPAFALLPEDVQLLTVPANGDPISGIADSVHLLPFAETLDQPYDLEFSLADALLPEGDIYADHVGLFHWDEGFGFENQFVDSTREGDVLHATVRQTGIYFLQPIVPVADLEFQTTISGVVGQKLTITSQQLLSNQGVPLWDGFPFWVHVQGAEVLAASYDDAQGSYQVLSQDGVLSFTVVPQQPGTLQLFVATDFGSGASTGSLELDIADVTDVVSPPSAVRVFGQQLLWDASPDTDIAWYLLHYREQGQTEWNGVDLRELASPLAIAPGATAYGLQFEAYNEGLVYELALQAVDTLGQESAFSAVVTYTVPTADFEAVEQMIQDQTEYLDDVAFSEPAPLFPDLVDHWAREDVEYLASLGVVDGYQDGTFGPDNQVTRAQFVKMVMNAFNIELTSDVTVSSFRDVEEGAWFVPYLEVAREQGILDGYPDGTFRPYGEMNRAEGLKILLNAADIAVGSALRAEYEDVDYDEWYVPYVNTATEQGIVAGIPAVRRGRQVKFFDPIRPMKRSELVTILVRMVK